jgi:hypothetical protein
VRDVGSYSGDVSGELVGKTRRCTCRSQNSEMRLQAIHWVKHWLGNGRWSTWVPFTGFFPGGPLVGPQTAGSTVDN